MALTFLDGEAEKHGWRERERVLLHELLTGLVPLSLPLTHVPPHFLRKSKVSFLLFDRFPCSAADEWQGWAQSRLWLPQAECEPLRFLPVGSAVANGHREAPPTSLCLECGRPVVPSSPVCLFVFFLDRPLWVPEFITELGEPPTFPGPHLHPLPGARTPAHQELTPEQSPQPSGWVPVRSLSGQMGS